MMPHFGKFVVEPLERGYGTTLGNSLRRILYPHFQALLSHRFKSMEHFMSFQQSKVLLKMSQRSF